MSGLNVAISLNEDKLHNDLFNRVDGNIIFVNGLQVVCFLCIILVTVTMTLDHRFGM